MAWAWGSEVDALDMDADRPPALGAAPCNSKGPDREGEHYVMHIHTHIHIHIRIHIHIHINVYMHDSQIPRNTRTRL